MKWEDPPNEKFGVKNAHAEAAAELRAHPKRWGVIAEFPLRESSRRRGDNNPGRHLANDIKSGKYLQFRPAGAFDAKSRTVTNDEGVTVIRVYGYYKGDNNA